MDTPYAHPTTALSFSETAPRSPVKLHRGFAFVDFTVNGTLRCGNTLSLPLEIKSVTTTYSYEVNPPVIGNMTDYKLIATDEWAGAAELDNIIKEAKNWNFGHYAGRFYGNRPNVTIGIAAGAGLALVIAILVTVRPRQRYSGQGLTFPSCRRCTV